MPPVSTIPSPREPADRAILRVRSGRLNVLRTGAVADGSTPCTAAFQEALDRCGRAGGGVVWVPPGRFVVGTLWLRDNVTLELCPGAMLLASLNPGDFPLWVSRWEGDAVAPMHAPLIGGEDLQNVSILGRGCIDGRGAHWWDRFNNGQLVHTRPNLLRLVHCRNVTIDGVTLVNSPRWTVNPTACQDVTITRVTVQNPIDSPNTDGISLDSCRDVHVAHCHVDVGDDCVTIKSGSEADGRQTLLTSQNITITNCTMLHGHGGVVVGSETSGGVRNVVVGNCVFDGTDRGLRFKSRRGRGGIVENFRADNLVMDRVQCPLVMNLFYDCDLSTAPAGAMDLAAHPVDAGTPLFRRLRFSNITAHRAKFAAGFLLGLPERPIQDVALEHVSIDMDPDHAEPGPPAMAAHAVPLCRAGLQVRHVQQLRLRGVEIGHQLGPAVSLRGSERAVIDGLYSPDGSPPPVEIDGQLSGAVPYRRYGHVQPAAGNGSSF